MMNAYPEIYLAKAMETMGDAFDYAVNDCGIPGGDFVGMFVNSTICRRIEKGEAKYLAGKSGVEIAVECVEEVCGKAPDAASRETFSRSPAYWCGWAACYCQWASARPYADIFAAVPFTDFLSLYPTLHEADIEKVYDVIKRRMNESRSETNLKRIRKTYGCSQSELAALSGVSLRSIQMYEQRKKNINKSQSDTLRNIARALGCGMEDIME